MPDIINLLPDAIANQIAAGEVIQRPASAVKEMMENAIDSGANKIHLILKEAGKNLIQVIDNGCGMSETDARMCFERHATSKINKADDLFAIRSFGFRGEALASIAAIAQVELKTKKTNEELGTHIIIEASEVKAQSPVSMNNGTNLAVKNLFYNVPARRNFLKSNQVELRHILEEFTRVALSYPDLSFKLTHNENELYQLKKQNLKQRIVALMGQNTQSNLVAVEEQTTIVNVAGFVGKPENARKTRGNQYFFVNNRFIKSPYLNHAVTNAYEELLPEAHFPLYVLFIEIDPKMIDINVHPTKTEIKFEDERSVYAIIYSAIKKSLSQYRIAPSLDFNNQEGRFVNFGDLASKINQQEIVEPEIAVNPFYNPFEVEKNNGNYRPEKKPNKNNWTQIYESVQAVEMPNEAEEIPLKTPPETEKALFQLHKKFIVSPIPSGLMLLEQNLAHQRILYEKLQKKLHQNQSKQQSLFPETILIEPMDAIIFREILDDVIALGFEIDVLENNQFTIRAKPANIEIKSMALLFQEILEQFKQNRNEFKLNLRDNLARSMARNLAVKVGKSLEPKEMNLIINELFACENPYYSPNGKPTLITINLEELEEKFD